jgi:hypothetical protein
MKIAAFVLAVSSIAFAQNKGTPIGTTGIPAPMLYDSGDPVSLSYPCDASHTGVPFYNRTSGASRPIWVCNGTNWIQALPAISATSVSIGGALIGLGSSVTGIASAPSALAGQNCIATPSDGTLLPVGITIDCAIITSGTATVRLSALIAGTPPAKTYNIRIIQ